MFNIIKRTLWKLDFDIKRRRSLSTFEANLISALEAYHIETVLDVGANVGQFARLLRSLGYNRRIVSFEPDPDCFKKLTEHAARDPLWECRNLGLSDSPDTLAFHRYNYSVLSSFSVLNEEGLKRFPDAREIGREEIRVSRLDASLSDRDLTSGAMFLKIDTQGHDLRVFAGADAVLPQITGLCCEIPFKPLYAEDLDWHHAIRAYEARGFRLSGVYPVSRNDQLELLEGDALFVRAQ
jgi:FkbM family methyltransferase